MVLIKKFAIFADEKDTKRFFMIAVIKLCRKNELFTHKKLKDGWAVSGSYVIGLSATHRLKKSRTSMRSPLFCIHKYFCDEIRSRKHFLFPQIDDRLKLPGFCTQKLGIFFHHRNFFFHRFRWSQTQLVNFLWFLLFSALNSDFSF